MLKQGFLYLFLSALAVVFAKYLHYLMKLIYSGYTQLALWMTQFVHPGGFGFFISKVLLIVIIPIVAAAIPALLYRLVTGKIMPYFFTLTWCIWLVIVIGIILHY